MKRYERFVFEDYRFDWDTQIAYLHYSFDEELFFEETFRFDFDRVSDVDEALLYRAFRGLWLLAGISYFKAVLPSKIEIKKGPFFTGEKDFFDTIYTHGLGEFFYQNKIDPTGRVQFPKGTTQQKEFFKTKQSFNGSLVLVGGGKDSLTTAEILKSQNEPFETLTVGAYPFFKNMLEIIGAPHNIVHRKLDSKLFELNKHGAYNGHVPISSILAFTSLLSAILRGKKNIVLSNEQSANEPNVVLDSGMKINHQYSKSLEFEKDFKSYVRDFISPDIQYFSFLRPLSEYTIANIFCQTCFDKYKYNFSSCNRNFKITQKNTTFSWCGACPKCAFVFLLFAPFLSRKDLHEIFGKDLWSDPALQSTFEELLGLRGIKPFECVGAIEEVRFAFHTARQKEDYHDFNRLMVPESTFVEVFGKHTMPEPFHTHIQTYIQDISLNGLRILSPSHSKQTFGSSRH